jgi:hypothetical protein
MGISLETMGFFCPNDLCSDYGKRGLGNIIIYNRYGRDNRRMLKCKTCNFKFSERRNTIFFGLHTKESTIKEVIMHLLDGKSFRQTAVMADIDKDTVLRIWKRFVAYCEECMDGLLKDFNIRLEDLITLLYQRSECSKKPFTPQAGDSRRAGSFWKTICGDEKLSAEEELCSGHE